MRHWNKHVIRQLNKDAADTEITVEGQILTESWDMDNRYVLDSWVGKTKAVSLPEEIIKSGSWTGAPHTTSSILLPTGSILTAYGTHYRAVEEGWEPFYGPRDTGLVKWDIDQ
jgi:hypothetical protein